MVKTHTGKTSNLWPVGCISDQFPTRGTPTTSLRLARQVSATTSLRLAQEVPTTRSLRLARQVSTTRSLRLARGVSAPTGTWAQTHGVSIATDACGGTNLHVMQGQQLAAMQTACPSKSLNAGLTSCTAITSSLLPTLPHASLSPRHSSTLYDVHKPRLRLGRGKLGKYSGRLRQAQTIRGGGQASRSEQSSPATRRLPRQGITTWLQYNPTDSDVRRDAPAAKHCNSFYFPLCSSPCHYKRERRATVTRVRPP
jgi:hypothetical protein